MGWTIGLAIAGFFLLLIGLRLLAGRWDRRRIEDYLRARGGRVVGITWRPFGRGWFGNERHRIYEVAYEDKGGDLRTATCKTNMFAGVFWTEDHVFQRATRRERRPARQPPGRRPDELDRLREENARLRAEIDRLRAEQR